MSSKINVMDIVRGHIGTLVATNGKSSFSDIFTFVVIPIVIACLGVYAGFNLNKDISSLLVNFGAIFTALLLSVLVLVYDQESKFDDRQKERVDKGLATDVFYLAKKQLLEHLYFNICFSIVSSILLIAICFFHAVIDNYRPEISILSFSFRPDISVYVLTPVALFFTGNVILTILMIVKRLHTLLTISK